MQTRAIVVLLAAGSTAAAQCPDLWHPGGMRINPDRGIRAVFGWDPDGAGPQLPHLAIAGLFAHVDTIAVPGFAVFDGASWRTYGEGPGFTVNDMCIHDGMLHAVGAPGRIARWTGTQWKLLHDGQNTLSACASFEGALYVSTWQSVSGASVHKLAGGQLIPAVPSSHAFDLIVHDGRLVVGGMHEICFYDGASTVSTPIGESDAVAFAAHDGHLHVGLESIDEGDYVRRWANGSWEPVGSGLLPVYAGGVSSIASHEGYLYAWGRFDVAGGGGYFARYGPQLGWQALPMYVTPRLFANWGDALVVNTASQANFLVAMRNDLYEYVGIPFICSSVARVLRHEGELLVVGSFQASPYGYHSIARRTGGDWELLSLPQCPASARAVESHRGALYVAGSVSTPGEPLIYRAGPSGWEPLPLTAGNEGWVNAMVSHGESLIIGGRNLGTPSQAVVRWNGAAIEAMPQPPSWTEALLNAGGVLYGGGDGWMARFDDAAAAWVPVGLQPGRSVSAMASEGAGVFAGGTAGFLGWVGRFDGQSWMYFPQPYRAPTTLAVHRGLLYIGGVDLPDHQLIPWIQRWSGTSWEHVDVAAPGLQGPSLQYGWVSDLCPDGDSLVVAGRFATVGGVVSPNLARLGPGEPACYPNCDCSAATPMLNASDFVCFLERFAAGDGYANCDQSTVAPVLNVADFTCFLRRFAGGCR